MNNDLRSFVETLSAERAAKASSLADFEMLSNLIRSALSRTFPDGALLCELLQNAVDAGAHRVRVATNSAAEDGRALVLEHDAPRLFTTDDVEAISSVGKSTKSIDSVGFMGVGFKSCYQLFHAVEISDRGGLRLKMVLEIERRNTGLAGHAGLDVRQWASVTIPKWSDDVPAPSSEYTTRFCFSNPRESTDGANPSRLVDAFLSGDSPVVLAVLAMRGLKRFEWINGDRVTVFELSAPPELLSADSVAASGVISCTAHGGSYLRARWLAARVRRELRADDPIAAAAVLDLLDHREVLVNPNRSAYVRGSALLVPISESGVPSPVPKGALHATLPTAVATELRATVQGDWLLNTARDNLARADRAWNTGIVSDLPDTLASLFRAALEIRDTGSQPVVGLLPVLEFFAGGRPGPDTDRLATLRTPEPMAAVASHLADLEIVPVLVDGRRELRRPREVILLPSEVARVFDGHPERRPDLLFGMPVVDRAGAGVGAIAGLRALGLLAEWCPSGCSQAVALEQNQAWWTCIAAPEQTAFGIVIELLAAIGALSTSAQEAWSQFVCLPTSTDGREIEGGAPTVRPMPGLHALAPNELSVEDILASWAGRPELREAFATWAKDNTPSPATRVDAKFVERIRRRVEELSSSRSSALAVFERFVQKVSLAERLRASLGATGVDSAAPSEEQQRLALAAATIAYRATHPDRWATCLLCDTPHGQRLVAPSDAVVAAPYESTDAARQLFSNDPIVSAGYASLCDDVTPAAWDAWFAQLGCRGRPRVVKVVPAPQLHLTDEGARRVSQEYGVAADKLAERSQNHATWADLVDFKLEVSDEAMRSAVFARWLSRIAITELCARARVKVSWHFRRPRYALGRMGSAQWVNRLNSTAWVPASDGSLRRPNEVCLEDNPSGVPVARLDRTFAEELVRAGVGFRPAPRLSLVPSNVHTSPTAMDERAFLDEVQRLGLAMRGSAVDYPAVLEQVRQLRVEIDGHLPIVIGRVAKAVGSGDRKRSALNGFVVSLDSVPGPIRSAVERSLPGWEWPETTTGEQALEFLRERVWSEGKRSSRPQKKFRDAVELASRFVRSDLDRDTRLLERLDLAAATVLLYVQATNGERQWVSLADSTERILRDDIDSSDVTEAVLTAGFYLIPQEEFGRDYGVMLERLGVRRLSVLGQVATESSERGIEFARKVQPRLDQLVRVLSAHAELDPANDDGDGSRDSDESAWPRQPIQLRMHAALSFVAAEHGIGPVALPVWRERGPGENVIHLGGTAAEDFVFDLVEELTREAGLDADQRGARRALTAAIVRIANAKEFARHGRTLAAILGVGWEAEAADEGDPTPKTDLLGAASVRGEGTTPRPSIPSTATPVPDAGGEMDNRAPLRPATLNGDVTSPKHARPDSSEVTHPMSSVAPLAAPAVRANRDQAANEPPSASAKTLADRPNSPRGGEFGASLRAPIELGDANDRAVGGTAGDDELARAIVVQFETACGRQPEVMPDLNPGFDIRSRDPGSGATRFIEVKGTSARYEADVVVALTPRQYRDALENAWSNYRDGEHWLYVAETFDGGRVITIPWTRYESGRRYNFRASVWLPLATGEPEREPPPTEPRDPARPNPGVRSE